MVHSSIDHKQLAVIVGATGAGKSSLALTVGRRLEAEIVCMDSMQVYRDLPIGTNAPTPGEEAALPHHLFGFAEVGQPLSCVRYAQLAREKIAEIQSRGRLALLVGGTGLYLRALIEGLSNLPVTPEALRDRLNRLVDRKGKEALYRMLKRLDPRGAGHLHANDRQRVQRFLEVRILSGESMLDHWSRDKEREDGPKPTVIGLEMARPLLVEKIAARTRAMLDKGWIEETRRLLAAGLGEALLRLAPIGYPEICGYLRGECDRETLAERIAILTRQYAKRQMTWFRKVPYIQWFPFQSESGYNTPRIIEFLNQRMN
ncbi:tRNA (adenosine(37)-N6)-dimethylallyltransferase MiaA [Sulfidibacter corallicola]|uniref:tRNA dimethylallyltransferase n=1 Tax=Sulfidibacter corallicola TaxID=2818388 RepID=A0A8A4TSJ8_SULCO|nr:tRNA (adenosine(37)-N6)-dimethylallyltransferase MiaA [Sulfidibacter corallicola]QTD52011.1 tRNA (adenosine(37)-N6)-dimethylallyltransferase MiaA [Sulfidibacter corallicola]